MNLNDPFSDYISDIIENDEFNKLKNIAHHGLNRYDHCYRVAYYSYKISKKLKLNCKEVARAAMLHDFFFENNADVNVKGKVRNLVKHPSYALENSLKYYDLTDMEKDIILTHMFPISLNPPKYVESWLVDIVDDAVAVYEKAYGVRKQLSFASSFIMILFLNYFK